MGSGNIRKFEIRLGQTGLMVLIVGMVALLCLSFLFGVGVGKNIDTYPEKISSLPQRFLALFWRPAKIAGGPNEEPKTTAQIQRGNVDLAFHQALTSSKTVPIQPQPDDKTAVGSKSKGREADSAPGSYQVYVASLQDREKADQIHKIVARAGYASKMVKVDLKEKGIWYRVIATGFDSKAKAQAAADKLSKRARTKCVVRQAAPDRVRKP